MCCYRWFLSRWARAEVTSSARRSKILAATSQSLEELLAVDALTIFELRQAPSDLAADFLVCVFIGIESYVHGPSPESSTFQQY